MISFTVRYDIPPPVVPEYRARSGRPMKYDWSAVGVGGSVLVPSLSAARTASNYGATRGRRFISEKQTTGERGWRVWRIA